MNPSKKSGQTNSPHLDERLTRRSPEELRSRAQRNERAIRLFEQALYAEEERQRCASKAKVLGEGSIPDGHSGRHDTAVDNAIRQLFNLLWRPVCNFFIVRRIPPDASEELAIETLYRFWNRSRQDIAQYIIDDKEINQLPYRLDPLAFLYGIQQKVLLEHIREFYKRQRAVSLDSMDDQGITVGERLIDPSGSAEDVFFSEADLILDELKPHLLPEQIFLLQAIAEKKDLQQLARRLGIPMNTLYQRISRARAAARNALNKKEV